ncbi:2-dehydro-3-deoxygalactonokinase [Microbulbifer bruguierae]|uniref:2-dehydro-3-deoxygalactonokinase n=1 Tax=Microbulbifer bruguierae TaxID=3029061 RepID=A0ABY8NIV3_9GAMM|nr:2-dehydro-3-deoxygalactonokinase [Microbulbifer bruguierae]WGL18380.1 2-dehydro-3-deoxygalactonokinase [Microbulbifer bruguierae]
MQRIVVDWGTTNIRAHLVDSDGGIAGSRNAPRGVHNCDGNFSDVLREYCGDWQIRWPGIPVYLCGMIGSRTGWVEAPYVGSPARPEALYRGLVPVPGENNVFVVPGVRCITPAGSPDVMRGEESQVLGVIAQGNIQNALVILPGTHSKWVRVRDGRIYDFATFFTGEMYALLHSHSSIGAVLKQEGHNRASFQRGLTESIGLGGLLNQVFTARSRTLCEDVTGQSMSAYLSGILIGSEFIHGQQLFAAEGEILLVGDKQLVTLYQQAAAHFGLEQRALDAAYAVVHGVAKICASADEKESRDFTCSDRPMSPIPQPSS